jgi:hypothetical protein
MLGAIDLGIANDGERARCEQAAQIIGESPELPQTDLELNKKKGHLARDEGVGGLKSARAGLLPRCPYRLCLVRRCREMMSQVTPAQGLNAERNGH